MMRNLVRAGWIGLSFAVLFAGRTARADECVEPECIERTPCETTDDCGVHRKCHVDTIVECPNDVDLTCRPGESDEACIARTKGEEETHCERIDRKLCLPVWQLACSDDAYCGAGLQCVDRGCEATGACATDADCPELFRCGVIDGGSCRSGADCVAGQRKLRRCLPPRVEGDRPDRAAAARDDRAPAAAGCSVRPTGERSGSRSLGWVALSALAVAVRLRRPRRRLE